MNPKIKTIAVLGAGAIGAYVIYGLKEQYKDNLWIIAEGQRAERLKKDGLIINEETCELQVKTPEEARGVDLLIVSVKYGALREILPMVGRIADRNTTVMSLLNGVDSEDILSELVPEDQIIPALIRIASSHKGNRITFPLPRENMGIIYGLPEMTDKARPAETCFAANETIKDGTVGLTRKQRLAAVQVCFENSRLESHVSDDIRKDIWMKYALNISQNIPQAILGAGVGIYEDSEHAEFLCRALRAEVTELADSYGIDIHVPDHLVTPKNTGIPKAARYSTLQDLDAKRQTEIEMFCGTVMRLAKEQGIPVPYNTFAYHVIKGLEEKNAGRFDYSTGSLERP
ncbi:MAG: 2-dehydropantoate 2-reductase [Eubacterium sp.]|nr:2-dehydropantoate 2-reductase [Eubacterium sp.]